MIPIPRTSLRPLRVRAASFGHVSLYIDDHTLYGVVPAAEILDLLQDFRQQLDVIEPFLPLEIEKEQHCPQCGQVAAQSDYLCTVCRQEFPA
jgi:hypothetical protein